MVLGLTRPRLRADRSRLFAIRDTPMALQPPRSWAAERGATLFETTADLIGGFPGYADRGGLLYGANLQITDRFLVVDEGLAHGFGLPLSWIEGSALVNQPGRDDFALRVFYRAAGAPRLFTIRFRVSRIGARGQRRSVRAQEVLRAAGIADRYADNPPAEPNFTVPWDRTREFEHENVLWTGRASAPVRVGTESAPSEVWLTTKSLIWGSGDGEGINRVPLPLLMDLVSTRLRDRLGTPAIYLGIGDPSTGRYELPFVFDLHTPPDRNFRERGAFLVGLRSRGIEDGAAVAPCQPWRTSLLAPEEAAVPVEPAADEPASAAAPEAGFSEFDQWQVPIAPPRSRGFGRRLLRTPDGPVERPAEPVAELPEPPVVDLELASEAGEPASAADPTAHSPDAAEITGPVEPTADAHDISTVAAEPADASDAIPEVLNDEIDAGDDPTEPFALVGAGTASAPPSSGDEDVVLAEWSAADEPAAGSEDVALAESWAADADARDEPDRQQVPVPESVQPQPDPASAEPWAAIKRYEETAVGALSEALRIVDARVAGREAAPLSEHAPSSWDQARALAELKELVLSGAVSADEARHRQERLLALGEVCVRLRTLIELHASGHLSAADLDEKRANLMQRLSTALVRPNPPTGNGVA